MQTIRCDCCKGFGTMLELPDQRIRYCLTCILRFQVRLTNMLGEASIRDMLNSEPKHRFTVFASIRDNGNYLWAIDFNKHIESDGKRCWRFVA